MNYKYYSVKINQLEQQKWTDKASYLKWVKEWKSLYKELTLDIRELRRELSKPHMVISFNDPRFDTSSRYHQSYKRTLRQYANCMMEIRKTGKKESWKNKQATKIEV